MNLFDDSTWKWWELKLISFGGFLFGLGLGVYFKTAIVDWQWLIWTAFVVVWGYVIIARLRK